MKDIEAFKKAFGSEEEFNMANEMKIYLEHLELKRKGFNTRYEWIKYQWIKEQLNKEN